VTRRTGAVLLAALLAILLPACAGISGSRKASFLTPADLESFELSGRINLRVDKEGFPGRVRWKHAPRRDELWFYSPVGAAVAHLRQDEQGALLVNAQGKEYRAEDLRTLAADVLGWDLPLEGLPYWVRGLPWPGSEAIDLQHDDQGRLSRLQQAGWQVSYLAWNGRGSDALPAKLDLQGERLRLRLLVENWAPGDASP
jgi:outer membrane lipoprotein LolB